MSRGNLSLKSLALLVGAMVWTLCISNGAIAQGMGTIGHGTDRCRYDNFGTHE
jgi:hypothetical protein